ncbi:MAG: hypothetical protein RL748_3855 [Pseudomonadota bacterium]|jgi:hypothetical protein
MRSTNYPAEFRAKAVNQQSGNTSKSSITANGVIRALVMYRQPSLRKTSENRDWLLETDVSTIGSAPDWMATM